MKCAASIDEIELNAFSLLDAAHKAENADAIELIRKGRVLYPIQYDGFLAFVPSKFIGYARNSVEKHMRKKAGLDGKETNVAVSRILGKPAADEYVENCFKEYCRSLGVTAANHKHRFWKVETVKRFIAPPGSAANDIALNEIGNSDPEYRKRMSRHYERDAKVRQIVLQRAEGVCEECGQPGFLKLDGKRYLETHHIISLSEEGADQPHNVIALCANDHRRAHFASDWQELQEKFLIKIEKYRA